MRTSPAEASFTAQAGIRGETVTVSRASQTCELTAIQGKSRLIVDDMAGASVEAESHDFIVRASDYAPGGIISVPTKGDRVQRTCSEQTFTYELISPPYDPHDHAGTFLRLHSVLVSVV